MKKSILQSVDLLIKEDRLGRKGVSKRKPSQKKAKKMAIVNAPSGVTVVGRETGKQLVNISDTDKVVDPTSSIKGKCSSDSRKNPRKV